MCSILFLLQFIILRSPLIFPRGPAGMAGHLYNLLYTNPLAIFCQINMTVASYLILPPYHTTAIPPTLQHGVIMPPFILYATCMPLLHIVCYLCTAGTATCVGTAVTLYCMLCTAGTATCVGTAAGSYCMLCILCSVGDATCVGLYYAGNFTQHVFKKKLLCFECAAYMLHGYVLM